MKHKNKMCSKRYYNIADASYDSYTSATNKNLPWCSGKLTERRKLPPNWETHSSYPLRENIWEYLHNSENLKSRGKRLYRKTNKPEKCCSRTTKLTFFLLCIMGAIGYYWKLYPNESLELLSKIIPRTRPMTNVCEPKELGNLSVTKECCYNMRRLKQELSRKERIIRNKYLATEDETDPFHTFQDIDASQLRFYLNEHNDDTRIEYLTAVKGNDTEELYSRSVSLWGVGPLWKTSLPADTVLSLEELQPADCWAFRGSTGSIHIQLKYPQKVTGMGLEHIKPDVAKSAPKTFQVYGVDLVNNKKELLKSTYRPNRYAKQYYSFNFMNSLKEVIFVVLSNYGNPNYTCIYRISLYGPEYRIPAGENVFNIMN